MVARICGRAADLGLECRRPSGIQEFRHRRIRTSRFRRGIREESLAKESQLAGGKRCEKHSAVILGIAYMEPPISDSEICEVIRAVSAILWRSLTAEERLYTKRIWEKERTNRCGPVFQSEERWTE